MTTTITGYSDDTIDVSGDINDDIDGYQVYRNAHYFLACSDGTLLRPKYGESGGAIWQFDVVKKGKLLRHVVYGSNEEDKNDEVVFNDGLVWIALVDEDELVKA